MDQHGPTVLRVCRALLARSDADDAWSETFLAALRAYPALPADANVRPGWSRSPTIRRSTPLGPRRAGPGRSATRRSGRPPRPTTAADGRLWAGWRALPDKQRQAVALHHVAGLPYAEVAERIGGTPAAARRAAADGIAALRRTWPPTVRTAPKEHTP